MDKIEQSVSDISKSVAELSTKHASLNTKFEEHIKQEVKKAILITIILFMATTIGSLLGYIWGKEDRNERIQERTERPFKESQRN